MARLIWGATYFFVCGRNALFCVGVTTCSSMARELLSEYLPVTPMQDSTWGLACVLFYSKPFEGIGWASCEVLSV